MKKLKNDIDWESLMDGIMFYMAIGAASALFWAILFIFLFII